jgi:hypothetical protein
MRREDREAVTGAADASIAVAARDLVDQGHRALGVYP